MTREETAERIKIMQAFVDGKQIQYKESDGKWKDVKDPMWSSIDEYRIKPEPKYRPFRSWTELRKEMWRHPPYGVVVAKEAKKAIFKIKNEVFAVYKSKTYEEAFKLLEFADGSVFGIKEE